MDIKNTAMKGLLVLGAMGYMLFHYQYTSTSHQLGGVDGLSAVVYAASCGTGSGSGGGGGSGTGGDSIPTGIENGKYGVNQVFDVQRSPAFPVAGSNFRLSSMTTPYSTLTRSQYTMTAGQYIQFFYNGGSCNGSANNIGIKLYNSDGSVAADIATNGSVYGIGDEGFLHVSDVGYGTFISNLEGFSNGDSITYVPETAGATCLNLQEFRANPTVLDDGETSDPCNLGEESGPTCGNGVLDTGETCDDGNDAASDGCSDTCTLEDGYLCTSAGAACTDIDECDAEVPVCDINASCTNTPGSFSCTCNIGYVGSGVSDEVPTCDFICLTEDDCDADGISDDEEEGSPLGNDVNRDGRPDSSQGNIVTAINPIVGAHTTTVVEGCANNESSVAFYREPDLGDNDIAYEYGLGLHGFTIDCGNLGATVNVVYYWDTIYDTATRIYRKYHEATRTFLNFNDEVTYGTATVNATTVTTVSFSVTDGGPYDADGVLNGIIVDPAGPAVLIPNTGGGGTTTTDTSGPDDGEPIASEEVAHDEEEENVLPLEENTEEEELLVSDQELVEITLDTPSIREQIQQHIDTAGSDEYTLPEMLPHTGASG